MPAQTVETPVWAPGRYQLDTSMNLLTPAERAARGKEARARVSRDSHAMFDPPTRSACWRSRRGRGSRNWYRSGGAG